MANDFLGVRSDAEIAVNGFAVACLEAAEIHEAAAASCEEPAIAVELRSLGASRRRASEAVGAYLAARYEGPNWPDQEKEWLKRATTRVKSALSGDATASLFADCLTEEECVRDAAEAALHVESSPSLRACIAEVQQDAEEHIRWLEAMRGE